MENITIIATIKAKERTNNLSNEDFFNEAKREGDLYTLYEFEFLCNIDEIDTKSVFIRVLEVSKSSFRLV